jgi:hypothetical protein
LAWAYPEAKRPPNLSRLVGRLSEERGEAELGAITRELRFAWDRPEAPLVLTIDQAEELVAADSSSSASAFLDLLREALAEA